MTYGETREEAISGADTVKATIMGSLRSAPTRTPGFPYFPALDQSYFEQLPGEALTTT